jgi:hypothetical protein
MRTTRPLDPDAAALRHLLEVLGDAGSETQTTNMKLAAIQPEPPRAPHATDDSIPFLILSTQRVIQHYRRLLAHATSEAERDAIHERIRREERVLRRLSGMHRSQTTAGQTYAEAA